MRLAMSKMGALFKVKDMTDTGHVYPCFGISRIKLLSEKTADNLIKRTE